MCLWSSVCGRGVQALRRPFYRAGKFLCAKKHHKKKKKKITVSSGTAAEDTEANEPAPTYEEVSLFYPRPNCKRPVVLVGPSNIGRHELRQKLMEDTERFAAAVPHTSRPRKDSELDGVDYHFISRPQFEADILAGKFVEHGEYERNYYGTSLDAIRSVVNSSKVCVLNLHPQVRRGRRGGTPAARFGNAIEPITDRMKFEQRKAARTGIGWLS